MLDTRELGRRPGVQRTMTFDAEAPTGLGIDVLSVPEGSQVHIDLRLEAVMEGVLATGTAQADLEGECSRCLEPIEDTVLVDFQQLFVYDDGEDDLSGDDDELDVSRLEDDLLDLEPTLRDAVVLALPFQPLCQDDCPGLCVECGARLADDPEHGHGEPVDPRWAVLSGLGTRSAESTESAEHDPHDPHDRQNPHDPQNDLHPDLEQDPTKE